MAVIPFIAEIARSERTDRFVFALLGVWRDSVRASHKFLTEQDILYLKPHVREALELLGRPLGERLQGGGTGGQNGIYILLPRVGQCLVH